MHVFRKPCESGSLCLSFKHMHYNLLEKLYASRHYYDIYNKTKMHTHTILNWKSLRKWTDVWIY